MQNNQKSCQCSNQQSAKPASTTGNCNSHAIGHRHLRNRWCHHWDRRIIRSILPNHRPHVDRLIAVASVCMLNVQKQCLNAIRDQSISYQEAMIYGLQQYRWRKVLVIPCVMLLYSVAYGCFLLLSMHISGTNLDNSGFWMTIMSLITDEHARTYSIIVAILTLGGNLVKNYSLVCVQLFNYLLIDTNKSTGQLMKNSLALVSRINPMIIVVISLIDCVLSYY